MGIQFWALKFEGINADSTNGCSEHMSYDEVQGMGSFRTSDARERSCHCPSPVVKPLVNRSLAKLGNQTWKKHLWPPKAGCNRSGPSWVWFTRLFQRGLGVLGSPATVFDCKLWGRCWHTAQNTSIQSSCPGAGRWALFTLLLQNVLAHRPSPLQLSRPLCANHGWVSWWRLAGPSAAICLTASDSLTAVLGCVVI